MLRGWFWHFPQRSAHNGMTWRDSAAGGCGVKGENFDKPRSEFQVFPSMSFQHSWEFFQTTRYRPTYSSIEKKFRKILLQRSRTAVTLSPDFLWVGNPPPPRYSSHQKARGAREKNELFKLSTPSTSSGNFLSQHGLNELRLRVVCCVLFENYHQKSKFFSRVFFSLFYFYSTDIALEVHGENAADPVTIILFDDFFFLLSLFHSHELSFSFTVALVYPSSISIYTTRYGRWVSLVKCKWANTTIHPSISQSYHTLPISTRLRVSTIGNNLWAIVKFQIIPSSLRARENMANYTRMVPIGHAP